MKKTISLFLSLLLLLSLLSGCGGSEAETAAPAAPENAPAADGTISQIVIGTTGVIETATRDEYNYEMLSTGATEIPLVSMDTEGQYHPLLADYATEDAQTWTYTIREGMCWDDGVPVTAEDILFTLEYEEGTGSAHFHDQTDAEGNVTAAKYTDYSISEDGRSISLTLASPNVRELSAMVYFRVMPKHVYEGKDSVTEAEARIGCGPFMFESFSKEAGTVTFAPNPYYPEKPRVDKLVYRIFGNEDVMYMALLNGDIDMTWNYSAGVSASYQSVLAGDERVTLLNVPAANMPAVLGFNNAKGFFADENLRLAVSCALDYEVFREYFGSEGSALPRRGAVPTTVAGYAETPELSQDLAKADEYMRKAGYTKNAEGRYVDGSGKTASFPLTVNSAKEAHVAYAELIKTQLESFGIAVELETLDSDSFNAKTSNKFSENKVTMEAAIYGYTSAGVGMVNGLATIYVDGSHNVQGGCQVFDEEFVAIRGEMAAAATVEQYNAAAAKMQGYYADHAPLIALFWDNMMYAHSSRLTNAWVDCNFGLNNAFNWYNIALK